jgi:FtsZ-interacting cell division protein ZipA
VDTWVIILIVVVVVALLVVLALTMAKRSQAGKVRKQNQAREHLQEARVRGVQADKEQALAEEQAARARRERAEVEERTAQAEREARERAARAGETRSEADQLRAKAEKLAPGVGAEEQSGRGTAQAAHRDEVPDRQQTAYREQTSTPDQQGGGATRR